MRAKLIATAIIIGACGAWLTGVLYVIGKASACL